MQITEFIQSLPKAELHLHLEGAMPWNMVQACAAEPLPDFPPWWVDNFQFENFEHFLKPFYLCLNTLTGIDRYYLAAEGLFKNLVAQNVRYVEISFSARHAISRGLPLVEVVTAIKQAAPVGLTVCVFCGLNRTTSHVFEGDGIDKIFNTPNLDGMDLHGDESACGPALFADIFAQAKQKGLMTKAHAGESAGPQSIKDALDLLQVTRIEHGVTAIQDEELMSRLVYERITLDMCPLSNVKLRVVPDISAHPIHQFHQRGINVTVSTDDPTIFGCSLTDELRSLVDNLHFSLIDLAQLQINAFQVALMPGSNRDATLAEINNLLTQAAD
jgi:adenosine deaminase